MQACALLANATAATVPAAVARLVRDLGDPGVAAALQALLFEGSLTPDDFLVAFPDDQPNVILGAVITQRLGGAQGALWPPVADAPPIVEALVAAAVARLESLGCRVLQTVVPIPAPPAMAAFTRAGFRCVTDLAYLQRDLSPADAMLATRLTLTPAAHDDLAFAELILKTYIDSRDLPELNGTRSAAEVLEGARVATRGESPLWWYASFAGANVGALQLTQIGDEEFELVYMGLTPEYRGRGLGAELAGCAVALVAARGGTRLHLSHDVRNDSAARAYTQLNFRETRRRAVWLKIFPRSGL